MTEASCQYKLKASRDALEVLQGKWRLPIIIALSEGTKRFGVIQQDIADISPKVLSQELKALERFEIVKRITDSEIPNKVEYLLTPLGQSLYPLLNEVLQWGIHFRNTVMHKTRD